MKNLKNLTLTLITGITLLASSCTTDETAPMINVSKVMERVDIKIVGSTTEYFYNESLQEESANDLIDYKFYGNGSNKIDFIIKIDDDRTITIKINNKLYPNPWEINDSYGTFATQDHESFPRHMSQEENQSKELSTPR